MNAKRLLLTRPRLTVATLIGALAFAIAQARFSLPTSALIAWNASAWVYLFSIWVLMFRATPEHIRHIARIQDESAARVLILVCSASVMSLVAILFELGTAGELSGWVRATHFALTGATLMGSWLLVPTTFAVHYAHLFYRAQRHTEATPVLQFPDRPHEPLYADFLYFSFTIAVASQTADVAVGNSQTRRVVLAQSILSFFFNAAILGLSINIGAGLVR